MRLSIVTTLYKTSSYIDEFYERMSCEARKLTDDYELIFVNDDSPDDSLKKAVVLFQADAHVKVIDLSRNFGHHKAMMTGLSHASGEHVFLIDSDLEEAPELLGDFWKEMEAQDDVDVVYGVQKNRKGNIFERWSGSFFYWLINKLSNVTIPKNVITARLTTQRYNQALISHQEREIFLAGLWVTAGFNQVPLVVEKKSHSETTYSLIHKLGLIINAITSFSNTPLKLVLYLGCCISALSAIFIMKIIINKLFFSVSLEGWSSLIVSIWFLGGLILFSIGVVGLYISKIFIETKCRPYTIIKDIYEEK